MKIAVFLALVATCQTEGKPWSSGHGWGPNQNVVVNKQPFKGCNQGQSQGPRPVQSQGQNQQWFQPLPNEHLVKPILNAWPRPTQTPQQSQQQQLSPNQNFNLVKPVFSAWPRPNQNQQQQQHSQNQNQNFNLVKPVFSAWPRPNQNQQQQQHSQNQNQNFNLVKPVFNAWPQSNRPLTSNKWNQNQQKKPTRPLVDVPFTIEIISNKQPSSNYGWSR